MWDGAKKIQFRRADAAAGAPRAAPAPEGREIKIELDGVTVTASLLEATAPRTADALWAALPLRGRATNTKWSGQMVRFWGPDGDLGQIPVHIDAAENGQVLHWPGYVYYHPTYRGIRICYGQAQQSGPTSVSSLTPLARLAGDWSAFRRAAAAIMFEGAKPMTITRKER
jgi:hypothetical protein